VIAATPALIQDVVSEDGGRRHQPRHLSQIVMGNDVGHAAAGVGVDGLVVGKRNDRQKGGDAQRNGPGQPHHSAPGQDEHQQNLLGGVGRGGESV